MLLALFAAMVVGAQDHQAEAAVELKNPLTGLQDAIVMQRSERLDPPKLSPKSFDGRKWEFDWITAGYGKTPSSNQMDLRFRVYSQERKAENDLAEQVAIMDLRIWEILSHRYGIDHPEMGHGLKLVDEYLCWGGQAGGEQTFGEDIEAGQPRRVNTIYIYDLASFKQPLEMAREVAHEYGHGVLPGVGGFRKPEDWANGYLGERLFLRWLRDTYEAGEIDSSSVMGTPFQRVDAWVKKNVDPLVLAASSNAPDPALLKNQGQKAMDAYMGLVLYADTVLPPHVVARSFKLIGSTSAADYPQALVEASSEGSYTVNIPSYLYGRKLWLPIGTSKVRGGKIVGRSGSWAQVKPTIGSLIVQAA